MSVVAEEIPKFEALPDEGWRKFRCSTEGAIAVTLDSGRVVRLAFREGWETDLTSTPRAFLWALPQLGPHVPASAAHDLALQMWREGKLTLREAREVGFSVLRGLPNVDPLSRFSWRLGVLFKDYVLRPLKL